MTEPGIGTDVVMIISPVEPWVCVSDLGCVSLVLAFYSHREEKKHTQRDRTEDSSVVSELLNGDFIRSEYICL